MLFNWQKHHSHSQTSYLTVLDDYKLIFIYIIVTEYLYYNQLRWGQTSINYALSLAYYGALSCCVSAYHEHDLLWLPHAHTDQTISVSCLWEVLVDGVIYLHVWL